MNYQYKYLKYKSKYLEKKYGRQFTYKIDYNNDDLDYKQKYFKYKLKYGGTRKLKVDYNNNFDYQQKYFKYKSKYLDIKYGGTCKLKIDYDNNFNYQQKYFKYKLKYLKLKKGGFWNHLDSLKNTIVSTAVKVTEPVIAPFTTATEIPKPAANTVPKPAATTVPKPAANTVPKPAATTVPKPAATTIPKAAATTVPKPAATTISKPAPKTVPKPAVTPVPKSVPKADETILDYLNNYFETNKVLTRSTKDGYSIINFVNNFFEQESKNQDGIVAHGRSKDIEKIMNKEIEKGFYKDGKIRDYDLNNYQDIKIILCNVIHKSIGNHITGNNKPGQNSIKNNLTKLYDDIIKNFFTQIIDLNELSI
jgi:hypothetical protein